MSTERKHTEPEPEALDEDELEQQDGEPLPDREVMTILPIEPTGTPDLVPPEPPLEAG